MKLYFLTYINRSGSSFLAEELSKNERIFVFPEADALINNLLLSKLSIEYLTKTILNLFTNDVKLKEWKFTNDEIISILNLSNNKANLFKNILKKFIEKNKITSNVVIFKYQDAYSKFNILKKLFSDDFNLVCLLRDPRAIFSSQKLSINPYSGKMFNTNPLITAYQWDSFISKVLNSSNIIIKYENFYSQTNFSIKNLTEFINNNNSSVKNKKTFYHYLSKQEKNLHKNINQPFIEENINKWEKNLSNIETTLIEKICSNNLKVLNYEVKKGNKFIFFKYYFYLIYYKIRIAIRIDRY